jgi:hypothetical protein
MLRQSNGGTDAMEAEQRPEGSHQNAQCGARPSAYGAGGHGHANLERLGAHNQILEGNSRGQKSRSMRGIWGSGFGCGGTQAQETSRCRRPPWDGLLRWQREADGAARWVFTVVTQAPRVTPTHNIIFYKLSLSFFHIYYFV